ncbi:MAG TPA: hypothetical protein VNT02_00365 [Burkholderiales bacterium]|nr:hypothetical protein [Burkholderiales bacterium]
MSGQINLLNPALRQRRDVVSLRNLAALAGVLVVAMAAVQAYVSHDLTRRRAELASVQEARNARATRMAVLQQAARQGAPSELGAEIRRLEAELRAQREGLSALQSGAAGSRQGYADYLRALSRGALSGLWLTGFTIAGSGEITLRGRLSRADLLPEYIQRLSTQPILSGRSFSTLDVAQPGARRDADAKAPSLQRDYLEFTLASAERPAAAASEGRAP